MASNVFGAKKFIPTAPDKGSFPLDHDGECKEFYTKYMLCLNSTDHNASECRRQSKDYLDCRMKRGLMEKESWTKLGFADLEEKEKAEKSAQMKK